VVPLVSSLLSLIAIGYVVHEDLVPNTWHN